MLPRVISDEPPQIQRMEPSSLITDLKKVADGSHIAWIGVRRRGLEVSKPGRVESFPQKWSRFVDKKIKHWELDDYLENLLTVRGYGPGKKSRISESREVFQFRKADVDGIVEKDTLQFQKAEWVEHCETLQDCESPYFERTESGSPKSVNLLWLTILKSKPIVCIKKV